MRRLVAAGVGMAIAIAGQVGAASAMAPAPAPTNIVVEVVVDAPLPVAGETRNEHAYLKSNGSPVEGETLELWVKRYGTDAFVLYDSALTGSDGGVVIPLKSWRNVRFQWRYEGAAAYQPSQSDTSIRYYSTRVRAKPRKIEVTRGHRVVFRGATRPVKSDFRLSLWRGETNRGGYGPRVHATRLKAGFTRSDGSFRITYRFKKAGWKKLFVQVHSGQGNVTGWSRYLYVHVT